MMYAGHNMMVLKFISVVVELHSTTGGIVHYLLIIIENYLYY